MTALRYNASPYFASPAKALFSWTKTNIEFVFNICYAPHDMRAVSKLRDRLKETTEQSILAAAEEVFAETGLHGARMETIAQNAGVSVGTLYNYFNDRVLTPRRSDCR